MICLFMYFVVKKTGGGPQGGTRPLVGCSIPPVPTFLSRSLYSFGCLRQCDFRACGLRVGLDGLSLDGLGLYGLGLGGCSCS
jgi:hypothetical protein